MKILAVAALFVSFSSLACPDLSGSYKTCTSKSGVFKHLLEAEVSRSMINGSPAFSISFLDADTNSIETEDFIADGKIVVNGNEMTLSSCSPKGLHIKRSFPMGSDEAYEVETVFTKVGSSLVMKWSGMDLDDTVICE
jgi:hypothetical protein